MDKRAVQEWCDAYQRITDWEDPYQAVNQDTDLFYDDPAYDNLRNYLRANIRKDAYLYHTISAAMVDLARELLKMPDEQWDLFCLSGFKYYKEKEK